MKRDYLHHIASALVILLAIVACVSPGQEVQPTSSLNFNAVGTSVAGTAQAALQQTAAAQSPVTVMTGTAIEQAPNGTTKYIDYDGGFEITFPAGWLAVRPNSEEFNTTLAKDGAANKMLHDQMTADQTGYGANDRLYSYVLRPDLKKNVMFGFSKLVWSSEDPVSIDNEFMGKTVRGLEAPGGIPGFHADTAQLHEDGAIKMIEISGRFMLSDGMGEPVPFYATVIFFKPSPRSTARIIFSFLNDYYTQISADVKSVVESISLIESR